MLKEIFCGRCGVDAPVEKIEYSSTYMNGRTHIAVEVIGRCPECGDVIGERHFFRYSRSEPMSEKEIELFSKNPLTNKSKYDIISMPKGKEIKQCLL